MSSMVNFTFTDPDQFQEHIRSANVEFLMTGCGAYRAELQHFELNRLAVETGRQSLAHLARVTTPADRSLVLFHSGADEPPSVMGKIAFHSGEITFGTEDSQHYFRGKPNTGWASLSPLSIDVAAAAWILDSPDLFRVPHSGVHRPPAPLMERLRKLHKAVSDLAMASPEILDRPEVAAAMEESLVRAAIACFSAGSLPSKQESSDRADMRIMRRLEETFEANPDRPLYLTELCENVGVSARVLRAQCQQHLGMCPHRYLWLRRMKLARRALTFADPAKATVTSVANDYGFGELGRFAVAYRELFDEPPSATLCRPADASQPEAKPRTGVP